MQGLELQHIVKPRIKATARGESLMFGFNLGPLHVFVIVNIPNEKHPTALAFVKITLKEVGEWEFFKMHNETSGADG